MKTKLSWLLPVLGAWLLSTCTMTPPPPGDFNITVQGAVYAVNGDAQAELTLTRGVTYTFSVNTPGHPFYITTDSSGGAGAPGEVTTGVGGAPIDVGTVTFTPDNSHVAPQYYYQCAVHLNMGSKINIIN